MTLDRRSFAALMASAVAGQALSFDSLSAASGPTGTSALSLDVKPITDEERKARLAKAQRLMGEQGISALLLEPGTSMTYFTGMGWSLSERPFVAILPAKGELAFVCPGFEEERARERIRFTKDVRVWQEDESPYKTMATLLKDRGISTGKVGVEERVRFFIADGLMRAAPGLTLVAADAITAGCRMYKSPAELALMQRANDITVAALKITLAQLKEGMTQYEIGAVQDQAMQKLGGSDTWTLVGLGTASAFPHGTVQPQKLREGEIVLIDTGCAVENYQSDITRTTVFGKATARQTEIWNLEKRAQDAAFKAAKVGATAGSVDDAARKVITDAGFGPDYKVPGLPHRTGHGIGMDGHEWTNFVRGNTTRLAPGMCFSDEPMIAIYGEFGVRLEDCLYITENGPKFFSPVSTAIDKPFG